MQEYYERYWFTATTRLKNSLGGGTDYAAQ